MGNTTKGYNKRESPPKQEVKLSSFQALSEFLKNSNSRLTDIKELFAYPNGELDFWFKDLDKTWYHIHMFTMVKSLEHMIRKDELVIYISKQRKYYFQIIN